MSFSNDNLVVDLVDGRQISAPIAWFPRLAEAMKIGRDRRELANWRLIGDGVGIHGPELYEDISVENLLASRADLLIYQEPATTPLPPNP